MIYFLSDIYKWTLTLLMVESSRAVFAIYLMRCCHIFDAVLPYISFYLLIKNGRKNHESTYDSVGEN